jgi:hypothetical protein
VATTTTTTTTETSSTTTTSTTTTAPSHVIQGEIINYGGAAAQIYIYIIRETWDADTLTAEIVSTGTSPISYSFTLEQAGSYYIIAADYNIETAPAVNNWIGGTNWTGTESVEAAGSIFAAMIAVQTNTGSVEVASTVTADVYMHQIIEATGEACITGTITWEWGSLPDQDHWGVPGVLIYDDPNGDPFDVIVGNVIATGEAAEYLYSFRGLSAGTYYLIGVVWYTTPEAGGENVIMGEYSDGGHPMMGGTMAPVTYEGTPISNINWQLLIVP